MEYSKQAFRFYAGVFLLTLSTLMLEVIQTRILSVTNWYYLAFFVIGIAMLGMTAGAVWVYLKQDRYTPKTLLGDLARHTCMFSTTAFASLLVQTTLAPPQTYLTMVVVYWFVLSLCMTAPFFFSGVAVSLALTRSPYPIGKVYAADLLGASFGCLCVLLLLNVTDGYSAVVWTCAFAALGAVVFRQMSSTVQPGSGRYWSILFSAPVLLAVLFAVIAFANGRTYYGIQPAYIKGFPNARDAALRYEKWNTFSRVALYNYNHLEPPLVWGKSSKLSPNIKIHQNRMNIDGAAGTAMVEFNGDPKSVIFLKYDLTNLAYFIRNSGKSAVIGVGGGRDLLSAWLFGFRDITGVELNPIFVDLLTEHPEFSNFAGLSDLPGVNIVVDEARSWFTRSEERFDLIQLSMIDTWAATSAGAFTLSENSLYTVEAFKTFIEHLTADGVLTVSRWYAPGEINETGRLLSLVMATLFDLGVKNPQDHLFLATAEDKIATLVICRSPFARRDINSLAANSNHLGYQIILQPGQPPASEVLKHITAAKNKPELVAYTSSLFLDLTPPTDNRPFFFNQLPLYHPLRVLRHVYNNTSNGGVVEGNLKATGTLLLSILIFMMLITAVIVVPLRPAIRNVGFPLTVNGTIYFALLGLAFMFSEIGMMQRFSIFLGSPTYSLGIVLFSVILSTGIGSYVSETIRLDSTLKFAIWAIVLAGCLIAMPQALSAIFAAFQGYGNGVRMVVSAAVLMPLGLLLGFGFPTGIRLVEAVSAKPTPWFWGINGATGVLASGLAVAVSLTLGIHANFYVGAFCYACLIPCMIGIQKIKTGE